MLWAIAFVPHVTPSMIFIFMCVFYSPDDEDRVLGGGWIASTAGKERSGSAITLIG